LYGTDAAKRSVEAGHYKDIDHALLVSRSADSRTKSV
jgi:hypothetical protein